MGVTKISDELGERVGVGERVVGVRVMLEDRVG